LPHGQAPVPTTAELLAQVSDRRRAVRQFDGRVVADDVLQAIMGQAQLAPSSRNSQPYRFLCIRSPELKAALASACRGQGAARSASALVVVTAGRSLALGTLDAWERRLSQAADLGEKSAAYHRAELRESRLFLRIGAWPLWSPMLAVFKLFRPAASLLPLGPGGVRHWTARNAVYAAEAFMLAASAHGLDTCPMEGFDAVKLSRALKLPPDLAIPLVIAIGYAAADARRDPRWRKPLEQAMALL
jgi:nitroreductase